MGLMMAVACGTHDDDVAAAHATPTISRDSVRAATAAESTAVARDQWNVPEVVRRLTEAGLVVTDRGKTAARPGFHVPGEVLDVSGSELRTYIYDNATARARDSAGLDTSTASTVAIGVPRRPRVIINNNLIALHFTPDDRLAEQVHDALMARHREVSQ